MDNKYNKYYDSTGMVLTEIYEKIDDNLNGYRELKIVIPGGIILQDLYLCLNHSNLSYTIYGA